MRKHFLILMLMALLPLAGWAEDNPAVLATPLKLQTMLVFDNQNHELLSNAVEYPADYNRSVGGIKFYVKFEDSAILTPEEKDAATSTLPIGKNAGKYYVWYQVLADGEVYNTPSEWTLVQNTFVRISPATPEITLPTAPSLTYNAIDQALITADGNATAPGQPSLPLYYSLTGGDDYILLTDENFATTIKGKNAKDYTVYVKVKAEEDATPNWVDHVEEMTVTINPKSLDNQDVTIALRNDFVNPVYSGTAKELNLTDIVIKWTDGNGDEATLATNGTDFAIEDYDDANHEATNINAGQATCNLRSGTNGNFTGGSVNFTIEQMPITADMFTIPDVTYTGATLTQANIVDATGFVANDGANDMIATTDYTLTTTAKNYTTSKGSTVTVAGVGNYKGSVNIKFDVAKAELTVNALPLTVVRGTSVTPDLLADKYEITGWVGEDDEAASKPAVTGTPTVICTGNTNNKGQQENAIEVSSIAEMSAANYTFAIGAKATLTVDANVLNIAFKDDINFYYKDVVPAFAHANDVEVLATVNEWFTVNYPEAVTDITVQMFDSENAAVAAATELEVGKTYTLRVTAKTINDNWTNPEIADKEITVQRYPLTVIAQDQSIAYGDGMKITNANADQYVIIKSGVTNTKFSKSGFDTKFGIAEYKPYFIANLEWIGDKTIANPGKVQVNLTNTYDAEVFDVTTENGDVTFNNVTVDLVLDRVAIPNAAAVTDPANTAAARIAEYDQAKGINVTITFPGHTMQKETWYSWVLPFNTSVKQISEAFGYAVVDILNEDGASKKSDVKFSLHMGDIDAGQPFILKVYQNITPEQFEAGAVKFNDVQIINGPTIDTDANGCQFIGTYTGKYGLATDGTEYLFRLGVNDYSRGGADSQIRPLGAYVKFAEASAGAHYIYIEEPDGSTTAISSIAADGEMIPAEGWYTINGVKLESMPTEKGVYIQNGKKVVIK